MQRLFNKASLIIFLGLMTLATASRAHDALTDIVKRIKPGIVGVGTFLPTRRPPAMLLGTGFVVGDGRHVVTNYHVVNKILNIQRQEHLTVFVGQGPAPERRRATKVALDKDHDLALLRIGGAALPALPLSRGDRVAEGTAVAFTGFPIGAVLGLYPVTHRGTLAAVTPIVTPVNHSGELNVKMIQRLRDTYSVYQLDATAYPGNSGSPVYDVQQGKVLGVINMVFIKETKESVLQKPSGISYAIPVKYVRALLRRAKVVHAGN